MINETFRKNKYLFTTNKHDEGYVLIKSDACYSFSFNVVRILECTRMYEKETYY